MRQCRLCVPTEFSTLTTTQSAVTNCQNPGYVCGNEIGNIIRILAGTGARVRRDRALHVIAARAEAQAKRV